MINFFFFFGVRVGIYKKEGKGHFGHCSLSNFLLWSVWFQFWRFDLWSLTLIIMQGYVWIGCKFKRLRIAMDIKWLRSNRQNQKNIDRSEKSGKLQAPKITLRHKKINQLRVCASIIRVYIMQNRSMELMAKHNGAESWWWHAKGLGTTSGACTWKCICHWLSVSQQIQQLMQRFVHSKLRCNLQFPIVQKHYSSLSKK